MSKPLHFSPIPAKAQQFGPSLGEVGAGLLGITDIKPVQREIWALHEARTPLGLPLYPRVSVEVTRRAGKTLALLALAIGRCSTIDDYSVTYCAQSLSKSRERFYEVLKMLRRHGQGDWTARRSNGEEQFEWGNGSVLRFRGPKAENFRGDALDWAILDEGQEVDETDSADLIGSLLPTFNTRDDAQLTVSGTAGAVRSGLLWEAMEKGRSGLWGILEYAAPEGSDVDDETVWLATYPGPAAGSKDTLTLLREMRSEMTAEMFGREYLGLWPMDTTRGAFDLDAWQRLGRELAQQQPQRFGFAFDVTPDGKRTAVMAAWRNDAGEVWVEVMQENSGRDWAVDFIGQLARKYRLPVGHDTAGIETLALADDIKRRYPNTTLTGLTTTDFAVACAVLDAAVRDGSLRHSRQQPLNEAVSVASRRAIRDGGWLWGRRASSGHIHTLVGATVALRMFDDLPAKRSVRIISA
ncbi:hypothetical protein ACWEOW_11205 [Monashia sp. NPDC004114]